MAFPINISYKASLAEKVFMGGLMQGVFGVAKGLGRGLTQGVRGARGLGRSIFGTLTDAITAKTPLTDKIADVLAGTVGVGAETVAQGLGTVAHETARATFPHLDRLGRRAVGMAFDLGENAAGEAVEYTMAAGEVGARVVDKLFSFKTIKAKDGTDVLDISLRPWVQHGAIPIALVGTGAYGALRGEIKSKMGYVDAGTMHNLTTEARTPNMGRRQITKLDTLNATGEIPFALHKLTQGR